MDFNAFIIIGLMLRYIVTSEIKIFFKFRTCVRSCICIALLVNVRRPFGLFQMYGAACAARIGDHDLQHLVVVVPKMGTTKCQQGFNFA